MFDHEKLGASDLSTAPLCLGGNVFGWTADREQSFAVLDAYAAAGGNFVDTADSYMYQFPGNDPGQSERIIAAWLAARGNRDDIVVATKVGDHPERKGLAPDNIRAALDDSLRRLGTDHVDLYYAHFDDESVSVEDIVTTFDELVRAGKTRALGASNISPARLDAMLRFARAEGLARFEVLQPQYNLVSRDTYEGERRDLVAREGLACVPYFALASGFLTGKYEPGTTGRYARDVPGLAGGYAGTERGTKVLAAMKEIAAAHGTELATVALAWLAQQPTVAAPIASARTVEQVPALVALADLRLTGDELQALDTASA
ncbi:MULTISPECIES: aldo/keto reductase [Streptomyces]|uniref:Aldo/keto reductase n=1 Tax=Streptomyces evansiae TaxID=3075535 RepID=A0ABD5EE18_9ACTN|nr:MULTISPECIES: aldo/keto reductase [unclassified Streptomyces]ASY35483.1 alcohol dehydrogenase [Streptomyces sp. CLI2509]EGJ78177.1 putative oxidoreductase [Streptomyces sp. Tu6071]MDT0412017.1 aldo/keto reductase [Streptomyces sp. DSM 41979]MDT0418832.1 aldo/keto reductase [Streptomyces sp. DSM 41982]MYQ60734.1 aldo/keto reductase [Streptomyces sp. SID4926]